MSELLKSNKKALEWRHSIVSRDLNNYENFDLLIVSATFNCTYNLTIDLFVLRKHQLLISYSIAKFLSKSSE